MVSRREFLRWTAFSGAGALLPVPWTADGRAGTVTVFHHVTVIDGTGAAPLRDVSLVLCGDRIAWIGRAPELPVIDGARVIDGRGKYVIPGLWDMHTHGLDYTEIFPPLHIANGVTGIREMWGYAENRAARDRIESGELLGPRVVLASSIIDGPVSLLGPPVTLVRTEQEARAAVRTAKADAADFLKVYSYLPADLYAVIVDEARKQGLIFAGHPPYRVPIAEISDVGQRSVEHLFGTPISVSDREAEFTARLAAEPFDPAAPRDFFNLAREIDRLALRAYNPAKAEALFSRFARNGTWQSPTLIVNLVTSLPAETYQHDPRLKYMPRDVREFWAAKIELYTPKTPEETVQQREFFEARQRLVGAMRGAGVSLLAGTDTLNPYCFPGFGLHDELELLVGSGLTPSQALRTATSDAARYLGLSEVTGSVTAGKAADLVILDANPLEDIRNTRKINTVVVRGRLITAEDRQKLLDGVEAAANRPPQAARAARLPKVGSCC